ncbi:MAG: hypothetical protein M3Y58_23910 [Chloroflexota bacterium]|nr:hypothetical protein [Chloroflexota bacterium]
MRQQHRHGRIIFFSFAVAIALVLAMATWVAADTTPTSVGVNTPVTFTGTGFAPNESLAIWITGADNNPLTQGGTQSDGSGAFTTSVTFPASGTWTATAHSDNTGKEFVGNYTVGTTSGTTIPPIPGTPAIPPPVGTSPVTSPASGATATGTQVGIGAPVTFSGTGFMANEAISVWETGPDGKVTALPGLHADTTGAFTTSVSFPSAGQWQVTAQGAASSHQVITPFAVGTAGAVSSVTNGPATGVPAVTTGTGTVGGAGFNGTPASIGTAVIFAGNGFTANEQISLWETPPDNSPVTALPSIQADNTGAFTDSVTFPSMGNWQVTAHGHTSAHELIGRYAVTDPSSTTNVPATTGTTTTTAPVSSATFTSPFTDVPVKATAGTVATYTATGFNAGETVTAWVTPPDASAVTPLPSTQASSTGRATVSTTFGSAGLWQITLHGRDSGHEVVGRYQVSATS